MEKKSIVINCKNAGPLNNIQFKIPPPKQLYQHEPIGRAIVEQTNKTLYKSDLLLFCVCVYGPGQFSHTHPVTNGQNSI